MSQHTQREADLIITIPVLGESASQQQLESHSAIVRCMLDENTIKHWQDSYDEIIL